MRSKSLIMELSHTNTPAVFVAALEVVLDLVKPVPSKHSSRCNTKLRPVVCSCLLWRSTTVNQHERMVCKTKM